jgi:hypothetical protein
VGTVFDVDGTAVLFFVDEAGGGVGGAEVDFFVVDDGGGGGVDDFFVEDDDGGGGVTVDFFVEDDGGGREEEVFFVGSGPVCVKNVMLGTQVMIVVTCGSVGSSGSPSCLFLMSACAGACDFVSLSPSLLTLG